jgi:rsbT antagonist protein RsbS
MDHNNDASEVTMYITGDCLVVPLEAELRDAALVRTGEAIPAKVQETGVKGVIIDFSAVSVIDSYAASLVDRTARAVSLLGSTAVISGIQPTAAASLVDLGLYFDGITKAASLDEALRILRRPAENARENSDGTR